MATAASKVVVLLQLLALLSSFTVHAGLAEAPKPYEHQSHHDHNHEDYHHHRHPPIYPPSSPYSREIRKWPISPSVEAPKPYEHQHGEHDHDNDHHHHEHDHRLHKHPPSYPPSNHHPWDTWPISPSAETPKPYEHHPHHDQHHEDYHHHKHPPIYPPSSPYSREFRKWPISPSVEAPKPYEHHHGEHEHEHDHHHHEHDHRHHKHPPSYPPSNHHPWDTWPISPSAETPKPYEHHHDHEHEHDHDHDHDHHEQDHHYHKHPPSYPPSYPYSKKLLEWVISSPVEAPKPYEHHHPHDHHNHSPTYPPTYPHPKKLLAVQGVVLCKSCKFLWQDNLSWSTPILGAVVRVECHTKYGNVNETGVTDKNGYFYITPKNIHGDAHAECKVFLVSSPLATCDVPTNLYGGISGATLRRTKTTKLPVGSRYHPAFDLYTVGPFAYQPKNPCQ